MCLWGYDHPAGGPRPVGLGPCQPRMWSAGPVEMEGGLSPTGAAMCKTYSIGAIVSVADDT
jgi:hypothetical protein